MRKKIATQVVTGRHTFIRELFTPVTNEQWDCRYKPASGGLWSSTYISGKSYVSAWDAWSLAEDYHVASYGYTFDINKRAQVWEIDSYEDCITTVDLFFSFTCSGIDWEKMAKVGYDVVHLTAKGRQNCSHHFAAWDVESCIILNPSMIYNIRPIQIR